MIAYKGFTKDLTAKLGKGIYQFEIGKTAIEESSQTAKNGFHCCENPFDCLAYYPLGQENRYFQVKAAGSIDEDANARIACTELTPLKELTLKELAGYGMMYMVQHPMRDGWRQGGQLLSIREDKAVMYSACGIAIARGERPLVRGVKGSILGLIREDTTGITGAKLFVAGEDAKADTWYTIDGRELVEVKDET